MVKVIHISMYSDYLSRQSKRILKHYLNRNEIPMQRGGCFLFHCGKKIIPCLIINKDTLTNYKTLFQINAARIEVMYQESKKRCICSIGTYYHKVFFSKN